MTLPWARPLTGGPDAHRYIALAGGASVPRPFHLRWLLPHLCGQSPRAWWIVWLGSWPLLAGGMICWQLANGADWRAMLAATALLAALPGILGPSAVIPVGVDLPATVLSLFAAALIDVDDGYRIAAGVIVAAVAATVRETSPIWIALWCWSPFPLIALIVAFIRHATVPTGPDPLGSRFDEIARHPVRAALAAHEGRWRDGWLMVAPWGVCLAALYQPDWRLLVVLGLAYGQLLIATDTVRLVHHAAGPPLAVAAATVIPPGWLLLAVVVHVCWWFKVERV